MTRPRKKKSSPPAPDRHVLYEASVQDVDHTLDFIQRVYKARRGHPANSLREDFAGTSQMACDWVRRNDRNQAYAVEIDPDVLAWAQTNNASRLSEDAQGRIHFIEADVLQAKVPKVDVLTAFNYSYAFFKERKVLLHYFRQARKGLRKGGIFFLDCFAGPGMMEATREPKVIEAHRDVLGVKVPRFTYTWEQESFNLVNHHMVCSIHFKTPGQKEMKRAFEYDWRLWSIPELTDLLHDAGFRQVDVYADSWVEKNQDTDGLYRRRKVIREMTSIIPYLVAE